MAERRIEVRGLANGRDLGGLPRIGGGLTPVGMLFRSERPDRLDEIGWRQLRALGVRTVVDLRLPAELDANPVHAPVDVLVRHIDLDGLENSSFWANYWDSGLSGTPLYYLAHLREMPERIAALLTAIATAPPGGVLFHCTGGRDRTGLVAAVLLAAAGADEDAIVADYLLSIENADALASAQGRANAESEVAALLASRGTTSEQAFRDFLGALDVDAILRRLPDDHAAAIRTWRGTLSAPSAG